MALFLVHSLLSSNNSHYAVFQACQVEIPLEVDKVVDVI